MRPRILVTFLVGALVCSTQAQATQPQAPTPGQPTPAPPTTPNRATPARERVLKGTAVLRGVVIAADTGKPVRRARVIASGAGMPRSVQTDVDGRFEIAELPAGKYSLSAVKSGFLSHLSQDAPRRVQPIELAAGQTVDKIVVTVWKGGVIAGQVLDEFGDPITGVEVRALRYQYVDGRRQLSQQFTQGRSSSSSTDDVGGFRLYGLEPGDYYISAQGGRDFRPFEHAAPDAEGPGQTFYPGTANPAEARRVSVRAGRETAGVVFPMVVTRLSRISGRVQTASGQPFIGSVNVGMRNLGGGSSSFAHPVRPDGTFEVGNLQPGTYVLTARRDLPPGETPTESARAVMTVNGDDLADLVLVAGPTGVARGRIMTDEGTAVPFTEGSLHIMPMSADPDLPSMMTQRPAVNPDGSFEVTGLLGQMHLRTTGAPTASASGEWTFKSVLLDGQDVTDAGIDFQPGRVFDNIDIVLTRKVSRISGELQDGGVPADNAWVVLFPADETKWRARSRYVRATPVAAKGAYRLTAVPHDDYMIVGVTGLEVGQWEDPDFLRVVRDLGTRIAIGEGESKVQNLKVVDWRK